MPAVAKKNQRRSRQPRPISGFGPSGRTVPVRLVTASSSLAYPVPQLGPGTSRSRPIRSRIAVKSVRGTATSVIWNVRVLERETIFAPILILEDGRLIVGTE